jgi:PAS domain S-box-containing protein
MRGSLKIVLFAIVLTTALIGAGCGEKCKCMKFCESSPMGFVSTDMDGKITFANPAFGKLVGYTAEELKGMDYRKLTPGKWHGTEKAYTDATQHMPFVRFEKEFVSKDGKSIPIEITGWLVRDAKGNPTGTSNFVVDMSGHVKSEDLAEMMGVSSN